MAETPAPIPRVKVDGKFFRLGGKKFFAKGITYGPFAPNAQNEHFPMPEQTARDFALIRELGATVLRVYYVPPRWLLDLADEHGLKLFIDIPWPKHLCFLDAEETRTQARVAVHQAAAAAKGHPAVFAYSVVNEISAEIVRWSGAARVERFVDELIAVGRAEDPDALFTFGCYPPIEFLRPDGVDFLCFNVYLHDRPSYESYLARLQTLADARPLVLGEFGVDSFREGEARQCEMLGWQVESAFRAGLAGTVVFSFTDDWFRGGMQIEDWAFGLTTRDRRPKASFQAVRHAYRAAPHFPLPRAPKVSVVVASYNGGRTLGACLESLTRLNYPDYEVILVDDGSTDDTAQIAARFPAVRCLRQTNQGLAVARNTGIAAATGEIVAFTDSDCRADEDWLYYLVGDLLSGGFAGVGGHNFLPPDDSAVAAAVVVSPGGPTHVMLTDREAEHIPGCNMAFGKRALDEILGFDPVFHRAGDDVDVCWRLQDRGYKIGFSPAGFVWHYRRSTVRAYLRQQAGYGEAEALLSRKHPRYFNSLGGSVWRGRIYAAGKLGVVFRRPVIYHGMFGSGFFQQLYAPEPTLPLMLCTALGYHVFVSLPLFLLSVYLADLLAVAIASVVLSVGVCVVAAAQAKVPKHKRRLWSRPLIALLFFLQPIVRGWARFKWRLNIPAGRRLPSLPDEASPLADGEPPEVAVYWTKGGVDRLAFLTALLARLERDRWSVKLDSGWGEHDLEVVGNAWTRLRLVTVTEELEQGRKNFRCRLQTAWSLRARLLFWASLAVEVALVDAWARLTPWVWMLFVTVPLLCWFLEEERLDLRGAITALLNDAAEQLGLVNLRTRPDSKPAA
jgi:glycosyltransferase involved in cell wall biosynthesis